MRFSAKIKGDSIDIKETDAFEAYVRSLDGRHVNIIIKEAEVSRSAQQNRLWWVYMTMIGEELGYTKNEMHQICKLRFLKETIVDDRTGAEIDVIGSTSKLSKKQFNKLIEELQRWAIEEFNIMLPDANEI